MAICKTKRFIMGISGASGAVFGLRLLSALLAQPAALYVAVSAAGRQVLAHETGLTDLSRESLMHWHVHKDGSHYFGEYCRAGRRMPVYNATLVGRPPMEDCYLAKATERLFLPLLQMVMPEVRDYWLPWEGVFHNIVVVSIHKAYAGHAQKVMSGLWGQGQMSFCKAIVVVDAEIDPRDYLAVLEQLVTRFDPREDITLTRGVLDVLDHSSPHANFGHKIGIDLTARMGGEPPRSALPQRPEPLPVEALSAACRRVAGVAALRPLPAGPASGAGNRTVAIAVVKSAGRSGRAIAMDLLALPDLAPFSLLLLYDREIDLADASLLLWKLFNNVDPGRDLLVLEGRIAVDACRKGPMDGHTREWPADLSFDDPGDHNTA